MLVVLFWPKLGLLTVGYYYIVYLLHSVLGDKAKRAQCTCLSVLCYNFTAFSQPFCLDIFPEWAVQGLLLGRLGK